MCLIMTDKCWKLSGIFSDHSSPPPLKCKGTLDVSKRSVKDDIIIVVDYGFLLSAAPARGERGQLPEFFRPQYPNKLSIQGHCSEDF